jgi:hypothetical protein
MAVVATGMAGVAFRVAVVAMRVAGAGSGRSGGRERAGRVWQTKGLVGLWHRWKRLTGGGGAGYRLLPMPSTGTTSKYKRPVVLAGLQQWDRYLQRFFLSPPFSETSIV